MIARLQQTTVHGVCGRSDVSADTLLGPRKLQRAKADCMGEKYPRFRQAQRHGGPYRPRRGARHARRNGNFAVHVITGCIFVGIASWTVTPQLINVWRTSSILATEVEAVERSVYYQGCDEVRSAGVAPIYRGSPGYHKGLDRDGDGVACEPYRGL